MRIIGEIPHTECKITLISWNEKYLIKIERGFCEQMFKISHLDVADAADLKGRIDSEFIRKAVARFEEMHNDLAALLH